MNDASRQIADAIDTGKIPWRMPHLPRNVLSDSVYGGVAPILLSLRGFSSPFWGTRFNWKAVSTGIIVAPDDGVCLPGQKETVFNLEQTDRGFEPPALTCCNPGEVFGILIKEAGIKIEYGIDAICHYERDKDLIRIPYPFMFIDGFFHALSHEIFHFSERRMDWDWDHSVADDELRADIGAGNFCAALGIKPVRATFRKHHDKFAPTWAADMRADPELLFRVCDSVTATISRLLRFVGIEVRWEISPGYRMSDSGGVTAKLPCTYEQGDPNN